MARFIKCIYWCEGGTTEQFMTAKEIVSERNVYRQAAYNALQKCGDKSVRHIVYYRDERKDDDMIQKAHFYPHLVGLNDDEFYERARAAGGFIGAVHRL